MDKTRRGFLRRVAAGALGLLGVGTASAATAVSPVRLHTYLDATKLAADYWRERYAIIGPIFGCRVERPNRHQDGAAFVKALADQLYLTGTGLVWEVPNKLGETMEVHVLPTAGTIPYPATKDYPNGLYRVQPPYTVGLPVSVAIAPIPVECVRRLTLPVPRADYGPSPLATVREHLAVMDAINRARWYNFQRGSYSC